MTMSNAVMLAGPARDKMTESLNNQAEIDSQEQPRRLTHRLDRQGRRRLAIQVAEAISFASRSASPLEAQFKLREAGRPIARDAFGRSFLKAARTHLAKGGIVQYENLPVTGGDDADSGDGRPTKGQALAAVISQGTTESLGYTQEDGGRHYQRLFPVPGAVNSGRTPGELLPHLDNPMLHTWAQPEVIHLVCVCNDAEAATKFFTMTGVLRGLREGFGDSVIERLQHPAYVTAVSNSFVTEGLSKSVTTRPRPVLYAKKGKKGPTHFLAKAFDISVAPDIDGRDLYEEALSAYIAVLKGRDDLAFHITAEPNCAFSFNQVRLIHGRGPIRNDKYRELVRAYGRFGFSDLLGHLGSVPPHFVFDASALIDR